MINGVISELSQFEIDYDSVDYCINTGTAGNEEAMNYIFNNSYYFDDYDFNQVVNLVSKNFAIIVLALIIPRFWMSKKDRQLMVLACLGHEEPVALYKIIRTENWVKFVAKSFGRQTQKINPAQQLEVAMMLGLSEDWCRIIIGRTGMKHTEHLILLAIKKHYSNDFVKALINTKGPRKYDFSFLLEFNELKIFPANFVSGYHD